MAVLGMVGVGCVGWGWGGERHGERVTPPWAPGEGIGRKRADGEHSLANARLCGRAWPKSLWC